MKKIRILRPQSYWNINVKGINEGEVPKRCRVIFPNKEKLSYQTHYYWHSYKHSSLHFASECPYIDEIILEIPDEAFVLVSSKIG